MTQPLTRILLRLFASGFYREHAGLLAFLFGTVVCYCIFIIPLNETHLEPAQRIVESLMFTLSLLSSPVMTAAVFMVWFIYTLKSWQYIRLQLQQESNQFLFYCITSFSRLKQFQSWVIVQTVILLPALGYALLTLVVGIIFGYYLAPFIILGYIVLLIAISAGIYTRLVNQPAEVNINYIQRLTRNRPKPFFTLFLYQIADQHKITYLLTKAMALFCIFSMSYFFADSTDLRAAGIITLLVCLAQALLIFHEFRFDQVYLGFARNFPASRAILYSRLVLLYIVLLSPEAIALFSSLPVFIAALLIFFALGIVLLFRCILLVTNTFTMRSYLWYITAISVFIFIAILFGKIEPVAFLNLPITAILFYKRYYRTQLLPF
jgi:hypothetical protein